MNESRKKFLSLACAAAVGTGAAGMSAFAENEVSAADTGSIVINEVCAKNTEFAAADGNFYDWIELYNPTSAAVDLSGYGLTDDESNAFRFTFPDNTSIDAGEHLLVFCNSKDFSLQGQLSALFGLSTDGETITLTDKNGNRKDSVTFGMIDSNTSYGRTSDGADSFAFMQMTPGKQNTTDSVIKKDIAAPVFSKQSGFYDEGFELTISSSEGTKIYYTVNSDDPTPSSNLYSSPFDISTNTSGSGTADQKHKPGGEEAGPGGPDGGNKQPAGEENKPPAGEDNKTPEGSGSGVKAVVVRAVACDDEGNCSDPVTAVYFVGFQNQASYFKNMKVISLVTDSNNLYDRQTGIFQNYDNSGAEWERIANMQIFNGGNSLLEQNVGIRVHGGYTRRFAQKSLNVYARSEYGASKVEFDLFNGSVFSETTGEQLKKFDSFILRNGGNDSQTCRFRDKLNQALVDDRNFLNQGMEPCIVFINGKFWGHYEITEKVGDDLIKDHYGVSKKNVCIIKNQKLDTGDEETYQEYKSLQEWIQKTDFSDSANYKELCSKVDMDSFCDYISANVYFGNKDWGYNNVAVWKSTKTDETNPYADGRWRFIMFDTEYSTNLYGQIPANTNTFSQLLGTKSFLTDLLKGALKNNDFRKQFSLTFMDIANYNFSSDRVNSLISKYSEQYKQIAADTLAAFYGDKNGSSTFSGAVSTVKSFYSDRYKNITSSLKNTCSLSGSLASVTVKNDAKCGTVSVNTLTPDMSSGSYTGKYYTDFPVTVKAVPASGYSFSGWQLSDGTIIKSSEAEIKLSGDNTTVTAVYSQGENNNSEENITPSEPEKQDPLKGDVNDDGSVNASDLVGLMNVLTGTSAGTSKSDVNGDGVVNIVDLIVLKNIILG